MNALFGGEWLAELKLGRNELSQLTNNIRMRSVTVRKKFADPQQFRECCECRSCRRLQRERA